MSGKWIIWDEIAQLPVNDNHYPTETAVLEVIDHALMQKAKGNSTYKFQYPQDWVARREDEI